MTQASEQEQDVVSIAEAYYDSDDADRFYMQVWGGEDIHIGLYDSPQISISEASRRTVARMADRLDGLAPGARVLDLGAGYGGAARYLAQRYGCHVTCLNLSDIQNARNTQLTLEAGLQNQVRVRHGNFEQIPEPDGSFDVVWSQDAILHSGNRVQVLREARRVLAPGGQLLMTDPMQAEVVPPGVLDAVLARIHLDTLGSFSFYRKHLTELGFVEVETEDLTGQLVAHYHRVREDLLARRDQLSSQVSGQYIERMLAGLQHWVDAGRAGHLAWGIMHYRLPDPSSTADRAQ